MRPCGHVLPFSNDYLRCLALLPSCTCRGGRIARTHLGNRQSSRPCRLSPVQGSCRSTVKTQSAPIANTSALQSSRDSIITFSSPAAAESTAAPPSVSSLHSSQEFQDVIEQNPGSLIVLMCKAQGCRPCKMFGRKFQRLAEQFEDAIFLDIMGDETNDTRRLMMKLDVRATPTFFLYRDRRLGQTLTGINENNLRNAITDFALPDEQDKAPLE
ncbi:MAG: thioredoxin [Trebouxia sp. A1-2]|nr:MAG: thioredoxin [Trebouxia sp. A1-2]